MFIKARKILGNGHNTDFSNTSSQLLNQNLTTNPQLINNNCNNGNNLIVTDTNCGISPLNLQQLQYMERIRLANIMNQGKIQIFFITCTYNGNL